jgi:hypothetical protein
MSAPKLTQFPQDPEGGEDYQPLPSAYLAPGQLVEPLPWPDRLVRVLWLDVWGLGHALRPVRLEMRAVALLLVLIFTFDYVTCTLLLNLILNRGAVEVNWLWTPIAAVLGLLPALLLFLYERGFLTADTVTYGWLRLAPPTLIRFCVIVAWALLTTQPLELLVFSRPIDERVHEESVLRKIAGVGKAFEEQKKKGETGEGLIEKTLANERASEAQNKDSAARAKAEELTSANRRLQQASSNETAAEIALTNARNKQKNVKENTPADTQALRDAEQKLSAAEDKAKAARTESRNAGLAAAQATKASSEARQDADSAENRSQQAIEDLKAEAKRRETDANLLRTQLERLHSSNTGEALPDFPGFHDAPYSFVDRLRVLEDLKHGQTWGWTRSNWESRTPQKTRIRAPGRRIGRMNEASLPAS